MEISKHAKERYAERIMDYNEKIDVSTFVVRNEEKIQTDLEKMLKYGELLYSGPSLKDKNNVVDVYRKDNWILLVDKNKQIIITVFKVDLKVDEEFSKEYVRRILERLATEKDNYSKVKEECDRVINEYSELIEKNSLEIEYYKKLINSLEEQNETYKTLRIQKNTDLKIADDRVRDVLSILTGGKTW